MVTDDDCGDGEEEEEGLSFDKRKGSVKGRKICPHSPFLLLLVIVNDKKVSCMLKDCGRKRK